MDWKQEMLWLTILYRLSEGKDKIPVITEGTDYSFIEKDLPDMSSDGLIDIDKPYIDYVPFFKMADTLYNKVTIRQLITHVSGMPYIQDTNYALILLKNTKV